MSNIFLESLKKDDNKNFNEFNDLTRAAYNINNKVNLNDKKDINLDILNKRPNDFTMNKNIFDKNNNKLNELNNEILELKSKLLKLDEKEEMIKERDLNIEKLNEKNNELIEKINILELNNNELNDKLVKLANNIVLKNKKIRELSKNTDDNLKINVSKMKDILHNKLKEKNEKIIEDKLKEYELEDNQDISKSDMSDIILKIMNNN